MAIELKDTLNLPKTNFSMRADLVKREPQRLEIWKQENLHKKIEAKNKGKPKFILHDGPPFTNGEAHIGTALNKILKDIILRYKSMQGFDAPFVPGWDCHGLPIEFKVLKKFQNKKKAPADAGELRKACDDFSEEWIKVQTSQFERLGVLGHWENPYKTKDPAYEAEILRTFATFVKKGLVHRQKKPVYWSIPCQTALAEAEVEYEDHTSPSVFVKFKIKEPAQLDTQSKEVFFVIWTTTPWTLPANLAIAVNPKITYQELLFKINGKEEAYLIAEPLIETFTNACALKILSKGKTYIGTSLEGITTEHPFIARESKVVIADYVTTDSGTGCVHTAPGHGPDDYLTGLKYGLDIYSPIDDYGRYIEDDWMPPTLVGLSLLEKNGKIPANEAVISLLKEKNALVYQTDIKHTYPFCWRSKTPIIFRATDQWFVALDKDNLRHNVAHGLKEVQWLPKWGYNRMHSAIESRPDWCISRQRSWGVPLPAFYDEAGNALLDAQVIHGIAHKIEQQGSQLWFEKPAEALLEGIELPSEFKGKKLSKSQDTLDVWIDSGTSHLSVLKKHPQLSWPADLYLEGTDQHRGWFQSSLWTSFVTQNKAPFKTLITHGFVVNEDKKKISKSDKKPQTATAYINTYGADMLRLWISSEDYRNDIPISDTIFKQTTQSYRTIRNTLRFQLGNLFDFDFQKDAIAVDALTLLDRWALHKTAELIEEVTQEYNNYNFHKAYRLLNQFCSVTLSATYHDILKDRLYTYAPNWHERRASQTAIYYIFNTLVRLLAPILTFTAEEAFSFFQTDSEKAPRSIHLEDWPKKESTWKCENTLQVIETIFEVKSKVNEKLEAARQNKILGQSLDAHVCIKGKALNPTFKLLETHKDLLPEIFIVSQVTLETNDFSEEEMSISIQHAEGVRCPRSWRWVPKLELIEGLGKVSARCKQALSEKL